MKGLWSLLLGLLIATSTASAASAAAEGSFSSPDTAVKPRFRYWLPDASADPDNVAKDIASLGAIGAGGTQFHNWFGSPTGKPPTNWTNYGYGTPQYVTVLKAAMQAHLDNDMVFDYAMSNNGAVPAEYNNVGLAWALTSATTAVDGGSYSGTLPGWGSGTFIAAQTYAITGQKSMTYEGWQGATSSYPQYTVSNSSLVDVSSLVDSNGSINVTVDAVNSAESYVLHAWYSYQPLGREIIAASSPPSWLYNGSLYVDHFSATGAKVITDFLEDYVLVDGAKELLQKVGHYLWEDSVEIPASLYWTPGLQDAFSDKYGYSILPYLPLVKKVGGYQAQKPTASYVTDAPDGGLGIQSDFISLLTDGLIAYYDHLVDWTNDLGLEFSGQMGYNLAVDMLEIVPVADAPEDETLSFLNRIDGFRQYAGPANLAGKQIISIELGADYKEGFWQTWTDLLKDAKRAFVGGVNQVVIHGADYSYNFTGTTWPGYTTHRYDYPEHSRHQPGWDVGHPQALSYLGRVQWVLQSGTPKVDLAFWDLQTPQPAPPKVLYSPTDLNDAGYTYEYLSPANFALDDASVTSGVLAASRQAFQALVVRGNDTLTANGVTYLSEYAAAGLPIIFSGALEYKFGTAVESDIKTANTTLAALLQSSNVHQVGYDGLAVTVLDLGIVPRSSVQSNGTWYTRWREVDNGDIYVFLYNDGPYSEGKITFQSTAVPFALNAWTGDQTQIVEFKSGSNGTTIPFALQANETRIIRFTEGTAVSVSVISGSDDVLDYNVSFTDIFAKVALTESATLTLSSGKTIEVNGTCAPAASILGDWNLTVEAWGPPDDLANLDIDATKTNQTVQLDGGFLESWYNLGLTDVSGIGYYTTAFNWSAPSGCAITDLGAYLVLPPITHGVAGTLNGKAIPDLDITNPRADISSYLVSGTNHLSLRVSSTLFNGIVPYWSSIKTAGRGPSLSVDDLLPSQDYGIIGEVKIIPYQLVQIA